MVWHVEEVGKKAFLVFRKSKGFGKGREWHLEGAERLFEHNVPSVDGQEEDLGSINNLFWNDYCL